MSTSSSDAAGSVPDRVRLTWPGDESDGEPHSPRHRRTTQREDDDVFSGEPGDRPLPVLQMDPSAGSAVRRAMVEAYDRLADRLLQRLRGIRDDMDADLAELRSEMAALRHAVDAMGDRAQLRYLMSSVDDLRREVAGLCRIVEVGDRSRPVVGGSASGQVLEELAALRAEVIALRRRISLRAGPTGSEALSDSQVERISEVVARRLIAEGALRRRR